MRAKRSNDSDVAAALDQTVRLFDLDEAERMLPLVRAIVGGMLSDDAERRSLIARLDDLDSELRDADRTPAEALEREIDGLGEKLLEAVDELADLGVEFKGLELGLVDFPTLVDDRPAYLCWRYGEERIAWWHRVDAGYAGRRAVLPDGPAPD